MPKIGMSSYCLTPAMSDGRKNIYDVIDFAKQNNCEHIEFVPFYLPFVNEINELDCALIDNVRKKCEDSGLEISSYSVNADIIKPDREERKAEIKRVKKHIDAAHHLGLKRMRHDVASFRRPFLKNTIFDFMKELHLMVEGTRELYEYAQSLDITTTLENHGFFVNGSDRVLLLLDVLECQKIRMTLDVGNFMCVDEICEAAVLKCIKYAEVIHLKDFYVRDKSDLSNQAVMFKCSEGSWFETMGGKILRGSILGQGDLNLKLIVSVIKNSDFDGYISVEFEGMEPCEVGTAISLQMARELFESLN